MNVTKNIGKLHLKIKQTPSPASLTFSAGAVKLNFIEDM